MKSKIMRIACLNLLLASGVFFSCVQEDSFEIPFLNGNPPDISEEQIVSIGALYTSWLQNTQGEGVYVLGETFSDKFLEGFVISSDEAGNFFEELHIQDRYENPEFGIKLLLDAGTLYAKYNVGRRVYVQLNGLSVGLNSGVFSLGLEESNAIKALSESQMNAQVLRDTLVKNIIPRPIGIGQISPANMNLYIRLDNVQFHRSQFYETATLTYAAEAGDLYDGERLLESCTDASMIYFSTSTYANFGLSELERGSGYIDGIALFDYYGEKRVFSVNSEVDIHLENENRCDPQVLNCDDENNGLQSIWNVDFEFVENSNDLLNQGWTILSILDGSTLWELDSFGGNNYIRISGYNSGETLIDSWLVSPFINLDATNKEELRFNVQSSYDNGADLTILASNDFQGDPLAATWQELDTAIPPGPYESFGDFIEIGPISLSCLDGDISIAFVYRGSDPFKTTRFHLDNLSIKGQ